MPCSVRTRLPKVRGLQMDGRDSEVRRDAIQFPFKGALFDMSWKRFLSLYPCMQPPILELSVFLSGLLLQYPPQDLATGALGHRIDKFHPSPQLLVVGDLAGQPVGNALL